jgi:RNA polymerase sigma factor (sigma-70 family)
MTKAVTSNLLQVLRRVVDDQRARELPDQDLLQGFIDRHDEAAFLALLRRHGPMVLSVCRALLPNEADAEDAFQATFLIFAGKARAIRKTPSLGSWLHGVAYRTARQAQTEFARRHKHKRLAVRREASCRDEMTWPEVQQVLHEELSGLSERYRAPRTLHYLQGKTLDESAVQLGLAKSTLKTRLERGRAVLHARLLRRGLGSEGALLAAAWPTVAEAGLPAVLLGSTTSAALTIAAGRTASAAVSAPVAALTEGVLKAMRITKLKLITAVVTVLALAGLGLGWLVYTMPPDPPAERQAPAPPQAGDRPVVVDKAKPGPLHLVLQVPPPVSVNSVAVSPDGSLIGTAADGVRLYDARTGSLLRAIGDAGDRGIAFSPDGRTLAAAGFHMDKLVGIYDVQTGKRLQSLAGHTEWETDALAFSPGGKLLASTGVDKQILVWELATGMLRHRLADQPFRVPALAFSPDSATLASGGGDKAICLWDAATGRLRRSLEGHRDWVCTLAFSPDGQTIASGSCDWAYHRGRDTAYFPGPDPACESQCKIWSTATGDLRRTISRPGRLLSLAFAPDGASLACGIGKDVRLDDVGAETPARVVTSHDFAVTSVAFTKGGSAILSGSHDHTVKRTSLATGQTELQLPGSFEQVNAVALSKDAALLATGSSDGRYANRVLTAGARCLAPGAVRLWDARTGRLLRRLGDPAEQVMAVALLPDGRRVAGGGGSTGGSGVVRLWDTATGTPVWSAEDHTAEVLAIAYAPDGSSVATAAADGLVKLRDPVTGAVRHTLAGHARGATALAFSADGALLACGDGRGGTRLWEARTGRLLRTHRTAGLLAAIAAAHPGHRLSTSLALTPDGRTLVTNAASVGAFFDEPVRFWDTQTGELKKEFADKGHGAQPVALSPDGSILAAGGKTVKLWDMRTGKLLRELVGHLKITQAITFSADGRWSAAAVTGRRMSGKSRPDDIWSRSLPSRRAERARSWLIGWPITPTGTTTARPASSATSRGGSRMTSRHPTPWAHGCIARIGSSPPSNSLARNRSRPEARASSSRAVNRGPNA